MSTMIEDLRWLADMRARNLSGDARKMYDGMVGSYWSLSPYEQALYSEATSVRHAADIVNGENDGEGWLHSWLWEDWEERAAERAARRAEAEALRAEIEHWVADYHRIFPVPCGLPPNLTLATRALALLQAEVGL